MIISGLAQGAPLSISVRIRQSATGLVPVWLWALIALIGAVDILWLALTDMALGGASWPFIAQNAAIVALCALLIPHCATARPDVNRRLVMLCEGLMALMVAWPVLRLYSHLIMSTGMPMADAPLARADAWLGFDWVGYVEFLDRHPVLVSAMDLTYTGLTSYTIMLFLLLLCGRDPQRHCRELIILFILSAAAAPTIGCLLPALGSAVYYNPPPDLFTHLNPMAGAYHIAHLAQLREGGATLNLANLPGLVTFPSFHTAMGVIAIYCTRHTPWLFAGSMAVNGLMIASTPLFGAHYAVDLAGGALLAAIIIGAVRFVTRCRGLSANPHCRILASSNEER